MEGGGGGRVPLGTNITKHKMVGGPTVVGFSCFSVSAASKWGKVDNSKSA